MNPPVRDETDSASQNILASLLSKIARAGATPIIVIPPRIRQSYFYPAPPIARYFPVFDMCDPSKYPELYREELHVNRSHFNERGAEIFTQLMAEEFVNAVRKP